MGVSHEFTIEGRELLRYGCSVVEIDEYVPSDLPEEYLARIVYRQYRFAFRAAEPAGFCRLEFLRADRALEDLWKNVGCAGLTFLAKKLDRLVQTIFDIEELREAEELKHFVDFRLYFEKHQLTAARFYRLEKGGE